MQCLFCGDKDTKTFLVGGEVLARLCEVHEHDARRKYGSADLIDGCRLCNCAAKCCRTKRG